jgi:hypothetical protein
MSLKNARLASLRDKLESKEVKEVISEQLAEVTEKKVEIKSKKSTK